MQLQTPLDKFIDPKYEEKNQKWLESRPKCWKCGEPITAIVEMNELVDGEWRQLCFGCFTTWCSDFKKVE